MGWLRLLGRLSTYTCPIRWTLLLLSAVTIVYLVLYILWDSYYSNGYSSDQNEPDPRRSSKIQRMLLDLVEQHENSILEGKGISVRGRHIQVVSAIHDIHHPKLSETKVVLPSFLQHSSNREFVCCFHKSASQNDYVEVPAILDFIDLRFIVDMQNAAFECILKSSQIKGDKPYQFLSVAPQSCAENKSPAIKIVYPVRRSWEFAVCTKVAYGRLEPTRLVEWFEYMREIGASQILTFYNNLHPDTRRVFDYYVASGFLQLIEYIPPSKKNGSRVLFTEKNSQTRQARHDKTLVVRDCQYRLGGYDFVITIDFDELPVPIRPYGSLNWILQNMLRNYTNAAAFRMDPILLPPEWQNPTRDLYHWQFSTGTYIAQYCIKWVYIPSRTWLAATHENIPKEGYQTYVIPQDVLHFLHFRTCKTDWREVPCQNLTATVKNELTLKRFLGGVLRNLRKLPLEDLIGDRDYIKFVRVDSKRTNNMKLSKVRIPVGYIIFYTMGLWFGTCAVLGKYIRRKVVLSIRSLVI